MRVLLADVDVESAAAVALAMHAAETFDECGPPAEGAGLQRGSGGPASDSDAYRRLVTALAKFWVTKRAVGVVAECLEAVGGNAFTESPRWRLARWYRQVPLNSLWEGAGNVVALDVQRTLAKEPAATAAAVARAATHADAHPRLAAHVARVAALLRSPAAGDATHARYVTEQLALMAQGAALARLAAVATDSGTPDGRAAATFDAWAATRLAPVSIGSGPAPPLLYGSVAP
jgi:putative acyl-CoA dehydrogenase